MCSFLVTNKSIEDFDSVNHYLKYRGPDHTSVLKDGDWTLVHNLLSITGQFTPQPLERNGVFLMFNGEIYNYLAQPGYSSEAEYMLSRYEEVGTSFLNELDGEFAIVILDRNKNILHFASDTFCTKPLYFANEGSRIAVSSYASAVSRTGFAKPNRAEPNTVYTFDLTDGVILASPIFTWDLSQTVDSYEPWEESFMAAVAKRTQQTRGTFLVPMSSGYDSGAIVCALQDIADKDFITYSFYGNENPQVIQDRLKTHSKKYIESSITEADKNNVLADFSKYVEPFYYGAHPGHIMYEGFDDRGAIGLYYILKRVKQEHNIRVQLSGQGGDEITGTIPTYGFNTRNPGEWPKDLNGIFPWGNFYYGANWSYLNKEECIAGSLGIETRYPLLDRKVVQSFINLTSEYKNKFYKSPLHAFMSKRKFAFRQEKLGFNLQIS